MQTEIAAKTILANLKGAAEGLFGDPLRSVTLNQIRMWLFPQKSEHDHEYDINRSYFESLVSLSLKSLMAQGLVISSPDEGIEDGDPATYSLTEKGHRYVEELVVAQE